jgi:multiple sugar transport system permease protein
VNNLENAPASIATPYRKGTAKKFTLSKLVPYLFIAPHLTIFSIFFAIPAITGIYISFTKWNLYSIPEWVGFKNYIEILLNKDSTFYFQLHNGLGNTLKFTLMTVPFFIIIPLLLAIALNTKTYGNKFFQSIFYMPTLLSISSVVLTWIFMFHRSLGPINNVLGIKVNWISQQPFTWIAWGIGGNMIIYLAGINGIDKALYEAAEIDGANAIKRFFHVTLPGLKNQIGYTLVITTIAQLNIYGQPFMLAKGSPNNTTRVLMIYIRELAFGSGESIAGLASAMAVILGLCIMAISIVQFSLTRSKD